jgi:hypothetical protein
MDKNTFLLSFRYLVLFIVVYLVLKFLPNQKMNDFDIGILTSIIFLTYMLLENLLSIFTSSSEPSLNSNSTKNLCNTLCKSTCDNKIENMASISPTNTINLDNVKERLAFLEKAYKEKAKNMNPDTMKKMEKEYAEMQKERINQDKKTTETNNDIIKSMYEKELQEIEESSVMDEEEVIEQEEEMEHEDVEVKEIVKKVGTQLIMKSPHKDLDDIEKNTGSKMIMKTKTKEVPGVERVGSRSASGVMMDEIDYTDYHHLPLGDNYDTGSFEYGYSFLPPEKWYPQPPFPPMCVSDKRCPVMPTYTTGTPLDVKEWNEARRVMPPDNIKTKYIKEKLNSGR